MKERFGIEKAKAERRKYPFERLRPGASWHVEDNAERLRILSAFKYWAKNVKKIEAKATSEKVGGDDPDGPGYRIWFVSTKRAQDAEGDI